MANPAMAHRGGGGPWPDCPPPGFATARRGLNASGKAAVTVRTYWAWETTATLRLLGGTRGAGASTGGEGRGIWCRHAHSYFFASKITQRLLKRFS